MSLQTRIANELFLSTQYISAITRSASKRYKEYEVPKRNGGWRTIYHPARELKALQRWLLTNVISGWPVHHSALAYRPNTSVKHNADLHRGNAFILKLDFDTFFPSISLHDVRAYVQAAPAEKLGWNKKDVNTFLSLVCRKGQLTIGAPTSPALSNAVCWELDNRLSAWAQERGAKYSRYSDDITLSSNVANVLSDAPEAVENILRNLPTPAALRLNNKKTRHLSRKHRRIITGIVLTPTSELSIGRAKKRKLRSLIHSYESLDDNGKKSLAGLLSYAVSIEPDLMNRLVIKYGPDLIERAARFPG